MYDIGSVEVLHSTEQVIDYCLDVFDLQVNGRLDDLLQVRLGQLEHYVKRVEGLLVPRLNHIQDVDDIGVAELPQQVYLS